MDVDVEDKMIKTTSRITSIEVTDEDGSTIRIFRDSEGWLHISIKNEDNYINSFRLNGVASIELNTEINRLMNEDEDRSRTAGQKQLDKDRIQTDAEEYNEKEE